ncbi:MAG: carbohydrate kinase family protein [Ignavibacteriaceae bacterium]|nr:carbohydrate kinase family protein [Ignavibacterium sp.]MCC6253330.1 carbohydrate kinase family protein [Ignavibacteriaceae bacterium]HRN26786.1 carbohydrate kinase family protein [Ignavibacteriaceae bacterium]HRP93830.1 carbohydrate kinase family protein [Ignavibacteriaceae bacterium]HRQ54528.1 carbohydrate kinase family protein [Ignavibacteriaceae bacterium]
MKLLIIGHSVLDFIKSDKIEKISAGGIYYTITALNRLKENDDQIFLCSQFDDESYSYFKPEFEKVNSKLLQKVDKIPRVHLNLQKDGERHEAYENITNNLSIDISNLNLFDGILINMITGFDITITQLNQIKNNFSGLIFMDVHTLSRGLNDDYKREFRLIPDFKTWAACLDIIQVNQNELFTISQKKTEMEIAEEILNTGVKVLCVTKGDLGAKIFYHRQNEITSYFIAANKISNPNIIGCGDIFGASFFYSYIRNKNAINSLTNAVANTEQFVANKFPG